MANVTVQLTSVRKTFGATVALDDCNLLAYEGEVHAIVGGNGSGKSTLAKVLSGVLIPDRGQVLVLGEVARTPLEARRLGICNVFQEVLVAEGCSVLDNLYLGADGLWSAAASREAKMERAGRFMRELVGFDIDLTTPVSELPLSLKQWVTIARGMLAEPKVLILDESSAALDYESTERLFAKMRELKARGTSILIVTHRVAELVRIADRATVLRDGRDVGCLERHEITEDRILELVAGAHADEGGEAPPPALLESRRPLMRVERARVWHDAGTLDFNLHPGEIVGITGLDGQGQADFVRALAGVAPLVSGRIAIVHNGASHEITGLREARENGISYVSGDRKKEGIFPNLSIFENLVLPVYRPHRLGGWLNIINTSRLVPVFEWDAGKLRVKMGSRDHLITSLSGGNQQKVLIARAFAEAPRVLVLNDPARGIDIGAKLDLYRNLKEFAAGDRAVVFLSSEIEEFVDLCTRVHVFRNGVISADFEPPFEPNVILNATFGQRRRPGADADEARPLSPPPPPIRFDDGRPMPRDAPRPHAATFQPDADTEDAMATRGSDFTLDSPDIEPRGHVPERFVEDNVRSPQLRWSGVPEGTRSFAIAVTDPDLPESFGFPRSFAHWLVHDIPAHVRDLPEGASGTAAMPPGARELNSDFVTFGIPGFGRGYGGPWPPDREHRYYFTVYALKRDRLDIDPEADLTGFYAAVMPVAIDSASFVAVYGPARKPLPG
jgi:Raf kinase inhibitor-like YbhB/YbcL family protein